MFLLQWVFQSLIVIGCNMTSFIGLIFCLLPGILAQCSVERAQPLLRRSIYEFSVALSSRIAEEKENHFVVSTFSPWTLLATASLGSAGVTLEELINVLRLHRYECFNDKYFEIVRTVSGEGNVTLERSSTIFVDETKHISQKFKLKVAFAGVAGIEQMNFDDSEKVGATVNDYVRRATHGTIDDIVIPSDLSGVPVIFIDALFFKGGWQVPFSPEQTEVGAFYNDSRVIIGTVNLMTMRGEFKMAVVDALNAKVLELPYGTDGRFAMLLFLPNFDTVLSSVINSLDRVSLTTIKMVINMRKQRDVSVTIPRFKISSNLDNLEEILSDMGMSSAFGPSANFPLLSGEPLHISKFVQKAGIEVTEEGATASAATMALFELRSGRLDSSIFFANRPFLYMIVDKKTEIPLFVGAYSKPSMY